VKRLLFVLILVFSMILTACRKEATPTPELPDDGEPPVTEGVELRFSY